MKKMNKKVKKAWIKELRHPGNKQCEGRLSDGIGFCCLGLLCNMGKNRDKNWKAPFYTISHSYMDERYDLPEEISKKAGLCAVALSKLVTMNDVECKSFPQIADWIEKNL